MEDLGNKTPLTLHVSKGDLGGGWSVINDPRTKHESLDLGLPTVNCPVVSGVPGYGFHPLQGVTTLPISESAVPNNGSTLPELLVLWVFFRCNLFDVSSAFWLFFHVNLLNHPHQPSITMNEWRVCRKVGRKTFNK